MTENKGPQRSRKGKAGIKPVTSEAAPRRLAWAAEIKDAIAQQGLTQSEVSKMIGVTPSVLTSWLKGGTDPHVRILGLLAARLGVPEAYQLALLGLLPDELGDPMTRFRVLSDLQRVLDVQTKSLQKFSESLNVRGPGLIAEALLSRSDDWGLELYPREIGGKYRVRYGTVMQVIPNSKRLEPLNDLRDEIEHLITSELNTADASWGLPVEERRRHPSAVPELCLHVPELNRTRVPGSNADGTLPASILVIGFENSGAPDVASLVADHFGWGFRDASAGVRQELGRRLRNTMSQDEWLHRQAQIAVRLMQRAETEAARYVWCFGSSASVIQAVPRLRDDLPLVVYLRPTAAMTATVANCANISQEVVRSADEAVMRELESREPDRWITLKLTDPTLDIDARFDSWVEQALESADWLERVHGGRERTQSMHDRHERPRSILAQFREGAGAA